MREWSEQTIQVITETGWQDVLAEICGTFAVHRPLNDFVSTFDSISTLTHIPSGRKLGGAFDYADHAKTVAEAIMAWPDADWTKAHPDLPKDARQRYEDERKKIEGAP